MKNIVASTLLLISLWIAGGVASAQSPYFRWVRGIEPFVNTAAVETHTVAVDDSGNVYVAGFFNGIVDFDPGSGTSKLNSVGNSLFVCKLNRNGGFLWVKSTQGNGSCSYNNIALDRTGNIYVAGSYTGTMDFDPGSGTTNFTTTMADNDIYICKFTGSGAFLWAKALSGPDGNNQCWDIAIDNKGNVLTTGSFTGTVDFNPSSSATVNVTSAGESDIFVSKLDSNGNYLWVKTMGGSEFDHSIKLVDLAVVMQTLIPAQGLAP
jgi:hypothetical protein